jgi:ATP-dependent Clp endopeptidase proteolytic subunit ClpP
MKPNLIQIENRRGKLSLNDGVHKESADKLIEELETLYGPAAVAAQMRIGDVVCAADDALESVEVVINSPGGSVFEGQRIYNALRGISARGVSVTTIVDGLAASMGSVILMAGDERRMNAGSRIMIHEASTMAMGDARSLRKTADLLDGISAEIAGIYADRTGGDPDKLRGLMLEETWMTADEAKKNGFVHSVIKDGKTKAEFDTPSKVMNLFTKFFPGKDESEIEAALADIDSLRNDLTSAQSQIEALKLDAIAKDESIIESVAKIAQLTESNTEAEAKLADAEKLANENAETITELQAKTEKVDELAAIKAAELLAAQGHPQPVNLVGDGGETKSILDQFNELKGGEATAFFKANRKAILAEQSKLNRKQ